MENEAPIFFWIGAVFLGAECSDVVGSLLGSYTQDLLERLGARGTRPRQRIRGFILDNL